MRVGRRGKTRGEQAEIHLFPSLKIELCCIFLHHKITQNIDLCLLFQEQVLGSRRCSRHCPAWLRLVVLLRVGMVPVPVPVLVAHPAPGTCIPHPRRIHLLMESPPERHKQTPPPPSA